MKFLFLKQPWPNLITLKLKTKESRWWSAKQIKYRGDVLICSSQKSMRPQDVKAIMTHAQFVEFEERRKKLHFDIYEPTSAALSVVNMFDYRDMAIEDEKDAFVKFQRGLKILDLQNIRPIVSFQVKGMLGLQDVPKEWEDQIRFE